jgi:acyl-CoA thioester hydrolase
MNAVEGDAESGKIDLTRRTAFVEWTSVTIRYADLDPNDHVNNGAINQFFEDGRVQFRTSRMAPLGAAALAGFALVRYSAVYRATLHYPGTVEVGTVVTRIGGSSYDLGQGLFQGDRCIATAEVTTVHIAGGRSAPLPDTVRSVLEAARSPG